MIGVFKLDRIIMGTKLSWTHPCCEACWIQREGTWEPVKGGQTVGQEYLVGVRQAVYFRDPDNPTVEECCYCGAPTIVGIFVREDPKEVSFPATEEEE